MKRKILAVLLSLAVAVTVQPVYADDSTDTTAGKESAALLTDATELKADLQALKDELQKLAEAVSEVPDGYDMNVFESELEKMLVSYTRAKVVNTLDGIIADGYKAIEEYPHNVVTELSVVSQTTDAIAIAFNSVPEGQIYRINYWATGSAVKKTVYAVDGKAVSEGGSATKKMYATICNLSPGEYTLQVEAGNYSALGKARFATDSLLTGGNAYASVKTATVPSQPDGVIINRLEMNADGDGYISVSISGLNSNMDNAYTSQVQVYSYKDNLLFTAAGSATGANKTTPKVENNRFYKVRARGVYTSDDGNRIYGVWSEYVYTGSGFTGLKYTAAKGKVTIKWPTYKGAARYLVYVSSKKNSGYKKKASVKGKSTSLKLDSGKTYYIKVRAYKTVDSTPVYVDSAAKKIVAG